MNVNTMDEG